MLNCQVKFDNQRMFCVENNGNTNEFGAKICKYKNKKCASILKDLKRIQTFINPDIKKFFISYLESLKDQKFDFNDIIHRIEKNYKISFMELQEQEKKIIETEYYHFFNKFNNKLSLEVLFNDPRMYIDYRREIISVYKKIQLGNRNKVFIKMDNIPIEVTIKNNNGTTCDVYIDNVLTIQNHTIHDNDFFILVAIYKKGKVKGTGKNGDVFEYNIEPRFKQNVETTIYTIIRKIDVIVDDVKQNDIINEASVIERMKRKNKNCNVIPLRQIYQNSIRDKTYYKHTYVYIMKNMKSDVDHYLRLFVNTLEKHNVKSDKAFFHSINEIAKEVYEQINCLFEVDSTFVYTDLKPQNVSVDYKDNNMITQVYLIDIGSVLSVDNDYISTYPCQDHEQGIITLKEDSEKIKCIFHQLLFFLFSCVCYLYDFNDLLTRLLFRYNNKYNRFNHTLVKTIFEILYISFSKHLNTKSFTLKFLKRFHSSYIS